MRGEQISWLNGYMNKWLSVDANGREEVMKEKKVLMILKVEIFYSHLKSIRPFNYAKM